MAISLDLAVNAIIAGLLLGGFYAAVTVGVTISFGMLDIANIAHPAFIMLGSFVAYALTSSFGLDPVLIGAAAHFECRNEYRHYGGDHIIFIGHVERYAYTNRPTLLFCRGKYMRGEPLISTC